MVTLTYREVDGWHAQHVKRFLDHVRKWMHRRHGGALRYTWVAELQQRGAVHYHVLVWLPRGLTMPMPDKQGWWTHGVTRVEWARNPVGYMVKYATKFQGRTDFPKGLRLHGSGGFEAEGRDWRHWQALPGWLRGQVGVGHRVARPLGGGFVLRSTGEVIRSPWRCSVSRGVVSVRELWRYSGAVEASGPYSMFPRDRAPEFARVELQPWAP